MRINNTPLLAGIDNLSLDKRKFDPSPDDIEGVCRFFSIGGLRRYEKEKGIVVSHSNFFVFAETTRGQYALKFYPLKEAKTITLEYAVNRLLINHHFATPVMYAGKAGHAFFTVNGLLATCYSYIDGIPAWQKIKQPSVYSKINASMLSLKNILSDNAGRVPFLKRENLPSRTAALARASRSLAPYDHKKIIDTALREACQAYQQFQASFNRRLVHNNASLTNMLVFKKTLHTLDLSHVQEDYALSDLASLVISCSFFDIPIATIKSIAQNYLAIHKINEGQSPVLNTLVRIGLAKEYLKNIQREKSAGSSAYPPELLRTYKDHLTKRKNAIAKLLIKMKGSA